MARSKALILAKGAGLELGDKPCGYFVKYRAIYAPKCGCVPCNVTYQHMQTYDEGVQEKRKELA